MNFAYVITYVPDVEAALAFYERAFGFSRRFIDLTGQYGELATGATVVAFASEALARENGVPVRISRLDDQAPGVELAFTTDDVEGATARALAAGATEVSPAAKKPWGQTVAYVRDLNGVLVELCTPVAL